MKVTLDPGAILPTRAHELDAGYDLYSREDAVIYAGDSWAFDTGVHMAIEPGWVGDVKSKSGMMMKYGIITDGTVDAGYTGSIRVKLFNLSNCAVSIVKGQKIAQLVIKKIATPDLEVVDRLEDTDRGANGFGSSGDFAKKPVAERLGFSPHDCETIYRCPVCKTNFGDWSVNMKDVRCPHCKTALDGIK